MRGPTKRSPRPISSSMEASTTTTPHKRNIFHGWLPMGTICPTSYTAARWQCCQREQNTLFGIIIEYSVEQGPKHSHDGQAVQQAILI